MFHIRWNTWHKLRIIVVATFVTFTVVNWSSIVRADTVPDWNANAVQALAAATPPHIETKRA
jgi:hypothetical protein